MDEVMTAGDASTGARSYSLESSIVPSNLPLLTAFLACAIAQFLKLFTTWRQANAATMRMKVTMRAAWGHGGRRAILVEVGMFRTLFTLSAKSHPTSHTLQVHLPSSPPQSKPIALFFTPVLRRDCQFSTTAASAANYGLLCTGQSPNFGLAKCISSVSSSAHTVEWNYAISSSESWDGGVCKAEELDLEKEDEDDAAVVSAALL